MAGGTPGQPATLNNVFAAATSSAVRNKRTDFKYFCPLCGQARSRRYTIKQHFPGCAKKNGNPRGLEWTDDESTRAYKPRSEAANKANLYNRDRKTWLKEQAKKRGAGREGQSERQDYIDWEIYVRALDETA